MTASIGTVQSILKVKYPNGILPKEMYDEAPFTASMTHKEDFGGKSKTIALQAERGQASSSNATLAIGQSATTQGQYFNFEITRNDHYGIARVTGAALEAAKGDANALVDLWDNETTQSSQGEVIVLEQYSFGTGNAVLGTILSTSTVASSTIYLSDTVYGSSAAISKFALGQQLTAVSDTTLSPTIRSGFATIIAIDRDSGSLTVSGNWNDAGNIPGILATDSLVRRGDAATGTNNVIVGTKGYIAGGPTPPTLFGLVRTSDVVRLAGQRYDAINQPMQDALTKAVAKRNQQFTKGKMVAWANTLDMGQLITSLGGQVQYTRVNVDSKVASIGFEAIDLMTSNGTIRLMESPFVERGDVHMIYMDSFALESNGPAPHLLNWDGPNFLRVATDDAYEVRFVSRAQMSCNSPAASIIMTGWGQ